MSNALGILRKYGSHVELLKLYCSHFYISWVQSCVLENFHCPTHFRLCRRYHCFKIYWSNWSQIANIFKRNLWVRIEERKFKCSENVLHYIIKKMAACARKWMNIYDKTFHEITTIERHEMLDKLISKQTTCSPAINKSRKLSYK